MSDLPPPLASRPADPPPTRRPDPFLGLVEYTFAAVLVFALLVLPILTALSDSVEADDAAAAGEAAAASVFGLFVFQLIFQMIQGGYPFIFSTRRGRTIKTDWRFAAQLPNDVGIGLLIAIACLVGSQIATTIAGLAVGLEDTAEASNTGILLDNQGSPWLWGVILLVVIGAPLAEELLFRGFVLRMLEKWTGTAFAIVVSSIIFAIPHWQPGATWQETVVLLSALAVVGLIFAIGVVKTNRLGPAMIGHFFFNATGVAFALFI